LIDSLAPEPTPEQIQRFRFEFWRQVAKATRNPIFEQQVGWWTALMTSTAQTGVPPREPIPNLRPTLVQNFYRSLARAMAAHEGAVQTFLTATRPVIDWMDQQHRELQDINRPG